MGGKGFGMVGILKCCSFSTSLFTSFIEVQGNIPQPIREPHSNTSPLFHKHNIRMKRPITWTTTYKRKLTFFFYERLILLVNSEIKYDDDDEVQHSLTTNTQDK